MRGRGGQLYDARRLVERSARVDAAIARLRGSPLEAGGARGARVPTKSAFNLNLVSTAEFYAHAGMRPGSTTLADVTAQHPSQVSDTNHSVAPRKDPSVALNEVLTFSKHPVVANQPLADTKTSAANATISGDKQQPNARTVRDKKQQTARNIEDRKRSAPTLIGNGQHPTTVTTNHGLAGLAGSRWADPPVTGTPIAEFSDPPVMNSSSLPVTEPYIPTVTKSSDCAVAGLSPPPVAKIPSQAAAGVRLTPTPNSAGTCPVTNIARQIILRSLEGVKISNNLISEKLGVVRFFTNLGSDSANLQIIIDNASVLDEPLYASDMFRDEGDEIIFQAYSEKGDGQIWKLKCPLPYHSAMLVTMIKNRVINIPRPIERQPLAVGTSGPPAKEERTIEVPSNKQASLKSAVMPAVYLNATRAAECELLIDFDAVEEPKSISPTIHILMGLMTDDRSITNFLERLDESPEGEFLNQIFAVAGCPPEEGYSAQMLSVARTLVVGLYTQSEIFHKLPTDVSEPLAYETSVKVLEKALSAWRAQRVEALQAAQTDEDQSVKPGSDSVVYHSDELISLRSRASTFKARLIPEYDSLSSEANTKGSSKAAPMSYKYQDEEYRCLLPIERSAHSNLDIKTFEPSSEASALVIKPPTSSRYDKVAIKQAAPFIPTPLATGKLTDVQDRKKWTNCVPDPTTYSKSAGATDRCELFNPLTPNRIISVKPPEALLSPEIDIKSESSDSELSSKLRALSLANTPARSIFISSPISTLKGRVGISALAVKKENINPTDVRTKAGNAGNANQSCFQSSFSTPQPASILEINNGDLKGNPGLAASRWAQPTSKNSPAAELRKATSSRSWHSPQTPSTSLAHSSQPDFCASNQLSVTSAHQLDTAGLYQPPLPFVPVTITPQEPLVSPQVQQSVLPQLITVLVTDPVTGQVKEVTGITKSTQPLMLYPGAYPAHHSPPAQPIPIGFPVSPTITSSDAGNKSHEPISL